MEARAISQTIYKTPRVIGRHIYANLYDCDRRVLSDTDKLVDIVETAAKIGNMTLLDIKAWKIGEGASIVAIVLESHITIHTWPEFAFATVDVYSCGTHTNPRKAFEYIVSELKPARIDYGEADRSLE